ncbi:LamB/YcsF family protein [Austwickia chelonae]|uniref:LamB/YcsF family protein n=1 Tax=Austwickia chelonae TaxID=100225 RepID=UPI000E225251|nr:5-oxoprolinase subunit PxpA [Austwickia chelonae]
MRIDLNADVGESFSRWSLGDDAELAPVLSSMNVACGFHAGDPFVMTRTIRLAAEHGLTVGAHVSYRDLAGFGRRFVDVEPEELSAEIRYQIGALQAVAAAEGVRVAYCKPHGALYNTIAHHRGQAQAVVDALRGLADAGTPLILLGLPGSLAGELADRAGLPTATEAFCDRAYTPEGTLVPRKDPRAVLRNPTVVAARAVRMVTSGVVDAVDGSTVRLHPDSLCVHGDSPGAVDLARAVRAALDNAGIQVTSFAGSTS